jgi:hypothetical protein
VKQKIGIAAALTTLVLAGGGTSGFIVYRLAAKAHAGEKARGDARPPAVAAQEPVTIAFSDDQMDDQKQRAEAGVRQVRRRFVAVPPGADADPQNGDVMVFNVDGAVLGGKGGRVMVRRSGSRVQGFAPAPPEAGPGAGAGGLGGGGYGGIAPPPVAPTPVPPPAR